MRRTANGLQVLSNSIQKLCERYIFFSDIEHDVCVIASGHRATLTYNLYFIPEARGPLRTISTPIPYWGLLVAPPCDPTILPKGSYPVFGLRRQYPMKRTDIVNYNVCLKRTDVAHGQVLTFIGAVWNVPVFYRKVGSYNDYIEEEGPAVEQLEKYDFDGTMGAFPQLVEFASTDSMNFLCSRMWWWDSIRPKLTDTDKSVCDKATKDAGYKI
ncbi:hypothetical protein EDC04DRAFT_2694846 [Pisolithus marmoratus]|nr:hypothetical protein EDC04DRAFT_2694846 [Pisolithus marmoratus]